MEHYYSEKQTSPLRKKEITSILRQNKLSFITASGTFSLSRIDKGTELLIQSCIIQPSWKILDIGCGYGPVGISIAKAFPQAEIMMADINERALMIAKENSRLNKVNVQIIKSDLYSNIDEKFDTILTNPPQTAGKDVCFKIIEGAKDHLKKEGLLQLVARHNKGGKTLAKKMEEVFGNVKDTAKEAGYRVYVSKN
ncbi:MAG TPA: class I SAM-dependent methyltransferase [Candidatus Nanoarchaeia archaeon]|nr:class I SAM-dependent methyltransferase [Candidatus Nanoarchaeia archaeon]